jgi:hypothetical protein
LTPALRNVTTRVVFGEPVRAEEVANGDVREAVLGETRRLIARCAAR